MFFNSSVLLLTSSLKETDFIILDVPMILVRSLSIISFLESLIFCQVKGCKGLATEVHHKKGRIGKLLTDIRYFLGVCRECHNKIELNPTWAKENGYSLNRLDK